MAKHLFSTYKVFGATFLLVLFTFSSVLKESYHIFWPHESHCCENSIEETQTTSTSNTCITTPEESCFLCQYIITINTPAKQVVAETITLNFLIIANNFPKNWLVSTSTFSQFLRGPPNYL